MKKLLLPAAAFIFLIFISIKIDIYAQDTGTEKEDNNTFETATIIQTEQNMQGTIATSEDIDYYQYSVSEKGFYRIGFMLKDSEDPLYMTVYDSDKNKLEDLEFDWLEPDSYTYTKKYEWDKGTVIYLKLFTDEEEWVLDTDAAYEVKPQIVKLYDLEQEPNDSFSTATTIRNSIDIHGTLSENEDIDYYCYTAEKTEKAVMKFYCEPKQITFGWNIEVFDSTKKKLLSVSEADENKKRTFSVKKGQKYYIKIYGGETCFHSNEAILNELYRINIQS